MSIGQCGKTYLTFILSAYVWSLITCGIGGLGTLMMAPVDSPLFGVNVFFACAGALAALVNTAFTMAIFQDNLGRKCGADEEEMWV